MFENVYLVFACIFRKTTVHAYPIQYLTRQVAIVMFHVYGKADHVKQPRRFLYTKKVRLTVYCF